MKRVILKRAGKEPELIETEREYANEVVKDLLGKDITKERVVVGKHFFMFVDGMGYFKELPVNFVINTTSEFFPRQAIMGDVVFIKCSDNYLYQEIWDYEVIDVTDEDIELVNFMTDN